MTTHEWYISAEGFGDGKSVCLWMKEGHISSKIARFQSKEAAMTFIEDWKFPLSPRVQAILDKEKERIKLWKLKN